MKKIDIDGIAISYKDVSDLNHKVKDVLLKIQRQRATIQSEFHSIRKKERSLKKFLGIKDTAKDAAQAVLISN